MFKIILLPVAAAVFVLAACAEPALAATGRDNHRQNVGQTMILLDVPRGITRVSDPISFTINKHDIPDDAVVEKISVQTGTIQNPAGMIVVSTYNIQGPGMSSFVSRKWAGARSDTVFTARDLGNAAVPVKGVWQISFSGRNISRLNFGTCSHRIAFVKVDYSFTRK